MVRLKICVREVHTVSKFSSRIFLLPMLIGNLLPRIGESCIRDDKIFTHAFGKAKSNSGYEALLNIGADILATAFSRMVQMLEFTKASDEGQF